MCLQVWYIPVDGSFFFFCMQYSSFSILCIPSIANSIYGIWYYNVSKDNKIYNTTSYSYISNKSIQFYVVVFLLAVKVLFLFFSRTRSDFPLPNFFRNDRIISFYTQNTKYIPCITVKICLWQDVAISIDLYFINNLPLHKFLFSSL